MSKAAPKKGSKTGSRKGSRRGTNYNLKFLHRADMKTIKDGNTYISEEKVAEDDRGLVIKYYVKDGDRIDKVLIVGKDNKFKLLETVNGEKKPEVEMTESEMMSYLGRDKRLKFAKDVLKSQKGGALLDKLKHGSRKKSRKMSRSKSRKSSRR